MKSSRYTFFTSLLCCIRPVWRSVFLHYNIFFRSGGQTFAGMRVRSCGAVLFRAAFAAQKLDLAAGRGCSLRAVDFICCALS